MRYILRAMALLGHDVIQDGRQDGFQIRSSKKSLEM